MQFIPLLFYVPVLIYIMNYIVYSHDVWHFASAQGLLFTMMGLLTLEDNNTSTPWEDIPVF